MNYKSMKSGAYRSGLEKAIATALTKNKLSFKYETLKLKYIKTSNHTSKRKEGSHQQTERNTYSLKNNTLLWTLDLYSVTLAASCTRELRLHTETGVLSMVISTQIN
jgi:hypothetical protein